MIKKNILISHTDYKIINNNFFKSQIRKARNFDTTDDLLYSCDIGLSTTIISKKILKSVKFPSLKTKEDFVFWLTHLKFGNKIFSLNKCLTYWYKTKGSLSSNFLQKVFDGYRVYRNYMNYSIFKSLICLLILSKNYLLKNL
jgi:teichuronic acid biosynthesis glycosyltransferase TuaG